MGERAVIAAFDFDGTITKKDTFLPYLDRAFGKTRVRLAFLSLAMEGFKVWFGFSSRDIFKEKIVRKLFANESLEELREVGLEHSKAINAWYRPAALEKIQWHRDQGHRLVMVSASLDLYLGHVVNQLAFDDLLCTRLSTTDNLRFDGRLNGLNCRRGEKVRLLELLLGPLENYEIYAYGDSDGDTEMLAVADHPHFMPFLK